MKTHTNKRVTWKISILNTKTGKISYRKVLRTYDGVTSLVKKIRRKSKYISVCAEEMDKRGKNLVLNGRTVALDSMEDERLFRKCASMVEEEEDVVDDNYAHIILINY